MILIVLPVQVWSFVCAYVVILLAFWSPDRTAVFKLLSVPVWTSLIFHVATVFGPVRVPVICLIVVLVAVSVVSGFKQTKTSTSEGAQIHGYFIINLLSACSRVLEVNS